MQERAFRILLVEDSLPDALLVTQRIDTGEIASYKSPSWTAAPPAVGASVVALVIDVEGQRVRVRVGALQGELTREDYAWTGKTSGAFLSAGDVVRAAS